MEAENSRSAPHRATDRMLRIIEHVAASPSGCTFTQIVEKLDAPKSSVHPIVRTLCQRGFLMYCAQSRAYKTGIRAFECGYSYLEQTDSMELIRDQMRLIVDVCGETCHLGILEGGDVLYLLKIDSSEPIRLHSSVGRRIPAYATGLGKALLVDYSLPMLKKLYPDGLKPVTENTLLSFEALFGQLSLAREEGIAYESEESERHIRCAGVPIRKNGRVMAAISIAAPMFRADDERMRLFGSLLKNARDKIERIVAGRDIDMHGS
jgi:IclR family KDG regulon transcriptional repressor